MSRFEVRDDICNTDALVGRMIRALGGFSGALRDFIGLMLKADPADRQTAEQLLEHAFLDNPDEDGWKQVVQLSMGNVAKV